MIRAALDPNLQAASPIVAASASSRARTPRPGAAEPRSGCWAPAVASRVTGSSGRTQLVAGVATTTVRGAGRGAAARCSGEAADGEATAASKRWRARTDLGLAEATADALVSGVAATAGGAEIGAATRRGCGCDIGRSGVPVTGSAPRGTARSARVGGATAGGGVALAGGASGAGCVSGAGAGGVAGVASGGKNVCGSRYPSGSALSLTPSWTYGTAYSGTPLGPTIATGCPSATASPRATSASPRWRSVTV